MLLGPGWSTASWAAATGGWQQGGGGDVPLCSALGRTHLEYCILAWVTQQRKVGEPLESDQWKAIRMLRGPQHLSSEDRLTELGMFSLEKGRLQEELIATFQCLTVAINRREIQSGLAIEGSQQTLLSVIFFTFPHSCILCVQHLPVHNCVEKVFLCYIQFPGEAKPSPCWLGRQSIEKTTLPPGCQLNNLPHKFHSPSHLHS